MAKLIGVTGAQGAGKTTMLNELELRGWSVDKFKVSRAVQAQLGWDSLERVMDHPHTMIRFQEEVFAQKLKNDFALRKIQDDRIILTERTFADVLAYATGWAWKFVDNGQLKLDKALEFVKSFASACSQAQLDCYDGVILVPMMSHIVFENDPNRAKAEDAERNFADMETFLMTSTFLRTPKLRITQKTVDDRVSQVTKFLEQFQSDEK